jgi:hypothetical protein
MRPLTAKAAGRRRMARPRELASERKPMSGGEGTSPSRWMPKMDRPTALARWLGATRFTIAEFTGPVDMKTRISAMTMAAV